MHPIPALPSDIFQNHAILCTFQPVPQYIGFYLALLEILLNSAPNSCPCSGGKVFPAESASGFLSENFCCGIPAASALYKRSLPDDILQKDISVPSCAAIWIPELRTVPRSPCGRLYTTDRPVSISTDFLLMCVPRFPALESYSGQCFP